MPEKQFDPTKPVQTRSGRPITLIATNDDGDFPLVGYDRNMRTPSGRREFLCWTAAGWFYLTPSAGYRCDFDLVNVPTKHEGWVNIYYIGPDPYSGQIYDSKQEADARALDSRSACIRIEWEE